MRFVAVELYKKSITCCVVEVVFGEHDRKNETPTP
jgi:hypothetical protein